LLGLGPHLLALALAATPAIDVAGDETCPRPADVAARLAELVAPAPPDVAHLRAFVSAVRAEVHVDLVDATGVRVAERAIPRHGTCEELARAVALVITTWAASLEGPGGGPAEQPPPATPPPAPALPAVKAVVGAPAPIPAPTQVLLTLGLVGSLAGGQLAEGIEIAVSARRAHWPLGARVALAASTDREQAVGPTPGAASWSRLAVTVGPSRDLRLAASRFEVHAALAAALLRVEGRGLASVSAAHAADLGATGGVRWIFPWGNAAPWVGAEVTGWPGHQRLEVSGLAAAGELPRLEVGLAAGLSLGRFP
jgi:hypothetical protein